MAKYKPRLADLPTHLRGFSNNRWGGHNSNNMRGFKGSKYGAASGVRHIQITPDIIAKYDLSNS